jgi:hypothetical protein
MVLRLVVLDLVSICCVVTCRLALVRDVPTITVDTGLRIVLAFEDLGFPGCHGSSHHPGMESSGCYGRCEVVRHFDSGAPHEPFIARSLRTARTALPAVPIPYALITITSHLYQGQKPVVDSTKEANRKSKLKEASLTDAARMCAGSPELAFVR